jgi:hypothetical protein
MTWFVELRGDSADLSQLERSFEMPGIGVERIDEKLFLRFSELDSEIEARAALQEANEVLPIVNGALRLSFDAWQSITAGSIFRMRDGKREYFLLPEPAVMRFRGFAPTLTITHPDGTVTTVPPADPVGDLTRRAAVDTAVASILRLVSKGDLNWVDLYRALEIVAADVGGGRAITDQEWCTNKSIELFKRTANSPGAVGLDARHGAENTVPPSIPMGIIEARTLIFTIIHAWLRGKGIHVD